MGQGMDECSWVVGTVGWHQENFSLATSLLYVGCLWDVAVSGYVTRLVFKTAVKCKKMPARIHVKFSLGCYSMGTCRCGCKRDGLPSHFEQ